MEATEYDPMVASALVESARKPYVPVLSEAERRAYAAAHAILALTDYGEWELVCSGAIRSRRIDRIAKAIMEEFAACR